MSYRRRLMGDIPIIEPTINYFRFEAVKKTVFTLNIPSNVSTTLVEYVEYSIDNGVSWIRTNNVNNQNVIITTPTIKRRKQVLWRGIASAYSTSSAYSYFSSTGKYKAKGNILSLLYGVDFSNFTTTKSNYSFRHLFHHSNTLVDAQNLTLGELKANAVSSYDSMFEECANMVFPPKEIKGSTIGTSDCQYMFYKCVSLVVAPVINIISAGPFSLRYMFYGCPKITYIKNLSKTISKESLRQHISATSGVYVKHIDAEWNTIGGDGVPSNWTTIYYNPSTNKYYLSDKTTECDDHGNVIN